MDLPVGDVQHCQDRPERHQLLTPPTWDSIMDEDFEPPEVAYSEERPLTSNLPDDVTTPMGQVDAYGAFARGLGRDTLIKIMIAAFVLILIAVTIGAISS